ncbi:MAG: hypothetical protein ACKO37_10200 [Vampirovibrionales bacterium]
MAWVFPEDAPLNYLTLKNTWFKEHPRQTPDILLLMQWAEKADTQATGMPQTLPYWTPWLPPSQRPWGVHPVVYLENTCGFDAQTDLQLQLYVHGCTRETPPASTLPLQPQTLDNTTCHHRLELFRGQKTIPFLASKTQEAVVFPFVSIVQPELLLHTPSTTPLTWWKWWEPTLELRSREGITLWGPSTLKTPSLLPKQAPQPHRFLFEHFWMRTPLWYY